MFYASAILTVGIIVLTCVISIIAFRNKAFESKHIFCSEWILAHKEYHRLITSAFLHSGASHLAFNMLSFYFFAEGIELVYGKGPLLTIYLGSILGGSLLSLFVHRHHHYFAYGASGGVAGVIFASILLFPGGNIHMFFIPVGIPSWLYAVVYLGGTFYAMKAQRDDIGHDAHLGGAIAGVIIATALQPGVISHSPILFSTLVAASAAMLLYVFYNPLFLPLRHHQHVPIRKSDRASRPLFLQGKTKKFNTDALLDKISKEGLHSLSDEERAFLKGVSEKYQRRAASKKPDSELIF